MTIRVLIWHEHRHEKKNKLVATIYPEGMHGALKAAFKGDANFKVDHALLDDDAEHGLSQKRLDETDVLLWWGHVAHGEVKDEIVERVARRVHEGMGLIVLHSGHFSKIFKRLMGTPCALKWREAGENERVWVLNRNHPIAAGLPEQIFIEHEEMYGEPFSIPEPMETVFISWFEGGEVFRSGVTYQRGAGKIFYFRLSHLPQSPGPASDPQRDALGP
jgi:trehalose utilization protein